MHHTMPQLYLLFGRRQLKVSPHLKEINYLGQDQIYVYRCKGQAHFPTVPMRVADIQSFVDTSLTRGTSCRFYRIMDEDLPHFFHDSNRNT